MKKTCLTLLSATSLAMIGFTLPAAAVSIAIPDPSFETNTSYNNHPDYTVVRVAGTGWIDHSGWTQTYDTGFAGQVGGNALQMAIDNGATVGTTPSRAELTTTVALGTYAANTTYTFTVAAVIPNQDDTVFARISLLGGAASVAATYSLAGNLFASGNTFQDITTSFTTGASGGFVGQNIYAQIAVDSSHQYGRNVTYDDLRLTATAIPEPSAVLLGGFGMLALLRRRRA